MNAHITYQRNHTTVDLDDRQLVYLTLTEEQRLFLSGVVGYEVIEGTAIRLEMPPHWDRSLPEASHVLG